MPLESDGRYGDSRLWLLFDRVEDAEIAQSKLPWRDGIGSQHLPFPRRQRRLVRQLSVHFIQDQLLRSPRERCQVIDRFWGVDDRESHDQPDADLDRASMPAAAYPANS